jgi:hypothetical protein
MATRREAERALTLYERRLSALPGVVGLGVQPSEEPGRDRYEVVVYVTEPAQPQEAQPESAIPVSLPLPTAKGDLAVPTRVIASGEFQFESEQGPQQR